MFRVLSEIGIGQKMLETAVQPKSWISRAWDTNEVLFELPLLGVAEKRYGAPYLQVHRGDFHRLIIENLAADTVKFGKKLTGLWDNGTSVDLKFEDGSNEKADIVVGADGLNSKVREALLGPEAPIYTGVIGHRVLFPASLLKGEPIEDFTKWWHPDKHAIVYNVTKNRDEIYIVTGVPQPVWESPASWLPCSKREFLACFEGVHAAAMRVLQLAPEGSISKWAFFERKPLPIWSSGRIVMLGDACHPMKPHMGQGGAMAIEDAAMLVRCIETTGVSAFRDAFHLYERNRQQRDLTDFLNQQDRDYCIGNISSRWFVTGMNVCGAGGRYPSAECGLIVL